MFVIKIRLFLYIASVLLCSPAFADNTDNNEELFDDFSGDSEQSFITSARMTSSYFDSPNSLSRLEYSDLNYLGIQSLTDALRLVPGMVVMDNSGSNSSVGYHGTTVVIPRRMEVLYNSNAMYRPGYSDIQWHRLPVDTKDLSAIEVVRGTSTVDYGSKAFTAAINMVPQSLATSPSFEVSTTHGSGDYQNSRLYQHTTFENGHLGLRYSHKANNGYDKNLTTDDYNDSSKGNNFLINGALNFSNGMLFDYTVASNRYEYHHNGSGTSETSKDESELDIVEFQFPEAATEENTSAIFKLNGSSRLAGGTLDWHTAYNLSRFKREQPMRFCSPALLFDPNLRALDASPNIHFEISDMNLMVGSSLMTGTAQLDKSVTDSLNENDIALLDAMGAKIQTAGLNGTMEEVCGETNQDVDELRHGVELQASLNLNNSLIFSSALSFYHLDIESETYLNGKVERDTISWSNNFRYFFTDNIVMNAGAMAETNTFSKDIILSSRGSINYQFMPSNYLRITASNSKRALSIHETQRTWNYFVEFDEGTVDYNGQESGLLPRNTVSNRDLKPEEIFSYELAYIYSEPLSRQVFDVKVFREELDNLVSEPFLYFFLDQSNNGSANLTGVEFSYQYSFKEISGAKIGTNYAYVDNDGETAAEKSLYARHNGSVWGIFPVSQKTTLGLAYYGSTEIGDTNYSRTDVTLTHEVPVKNAHLSFQLNYRNYPKAIGSFQELSIGERSQVSYNHQDRIYLTASLQY